MTKIVLQGYIIVPDIDLEIVKRELVTHAKLTNEESGCLIFEVTPDDYNPNKFNVYEEFVNQASFDIHQIRVKNSVWGDVTKNVIRNYQITNSE